MKTKARLYNPFPREPSNIGFLKGNLLTCPKALQSQTLATGHGFCIKWHAEEGGYLSVHHKDEPDRTVWSTVNGQAFVSGAIGEDTIQDSRGSFSIHDKAELILCHQTIEKIQAVKPQTVGNKNCAHIYENSDKVQNKTDTFFNDTLHGNEDGDGQKIQILGTAVIITGCLYTDPKTAACQHKHYLVSEEESSGPFYDINRGKNTLIGVRYWLIFWERRDHHLSFSLQFDHPVKQVPDVHSLALFHPKLKPVKAPQYVDNTSVYLDQILWLWSQRPLSAFERTNTYYFTNLMRPMVTLKRLIVNDMFALKKAETLTIEGHLEKTLMINEKSLALATEDFPALVTSPVNKGCRNPMGEKLECKLNRVILIYAADTDERFFGFGEQFSYFDLKGRRVPIMVQEQGLGRGDQPITAAVNLLSERSGGDWHTTYAPVPYYITSKSRCVFLEDYNYSVFDLTRPNKVQIQLHGEGLNGRILHGQTPIQLIERYTEAIGRMRKLPDWILEGAIVGMQGGTEAVRDALKELKEADVPISAFWLQDWVGQRKTSIGWQLWWNWEVDDNHYSGWDQLVKDLKEEGINTMAYVNPFIASTTDKPKRTRDLLEEASSHGHVVQGHNGEPYMIPNTSFDAAMVDLTSEKACQWLKDVMHGMIKTGVKGWMADFGESLPFDAKLASGEDPKEVHNRYPEMWARLNRKVIEETGDDELVFFMRAAYTRSPKWATLFWEGDQMVSWQRHDGIKSAVVGLLSSGLCGFTFNHSDIGGYCTVDLPFLRYRRSEELLHRWMELNAFSTIFRTHEGNIPKANHQFHTTPASLRHFARCAKLYKAWAFYRKQLVKEAAAVGLPVVRHMFLHYNEDPRCYSICYEQFLVGSEILVVPVVDKGRQHVWAYFPESPDEWKHVWTGALYSHKGHKPIRVASPLGYPAVFVKTHSKVGEIFLENLANLDLLPSSHETGLF